ncbi:hypothetical protein DM860_003704 [Cuscuta australis]|uniref:Uncharacterized protein n=1 Tax=Cuscuta australis TaxID=267555 RepID=A0A328DGL2_9ASTE|nr:hypothetical protein DM860_003704 [Cuscuta australis]
MEAREGKSLSIFSLLLPSSSHSIQFNSMAGWLFALAIMARYEMSKSEAAYQVYAKSCPYVQARAYYAQAQAAVQVEFIDTESLLSYSNISTNQWIQLFRHHFISMFRPSAQLCVLKLKGKTDPRLLLQPHPPASLDDACRSHVKSFLECVVVQSDLSPLEMGRVGLLCTSRLFLM